MWSRHTRVCALRRRGIKIPPLPSPPGSIGGRGLAMAVAQGEGADQALPAFDLPSNLPLQTSPSWCSPRCGVYRRRMGQSDIARVRVMCVRLG